MGILSWIIFGLIAGILAKWIMPGKDGGGFIVTVILGIVGAVVGGLVMGVLNNGMSILGIGIDWQQGIKGLVLLAAVAFDIYNQRNKR